MIAQLQAHLKSLQSETDTGEEWRRNNYTVHSSRDQKERTETDMWFYVMSSTTEVENYRAFKACTNKPEGQAATERTWNDPATHSTKEESVSVHYLFRCSDNILRHRSADWLLIWPNCHCCKASYTARKTVNMQQCRALLHRGRFFS